MRVADITENAGRWQEAEALWREVLQLCERDLGPEAPFTVQQQFGLARTLVKEKRWQEALPMLERVISLNQARFGSNDYSALILQCWLGQAYEQKGDVEGATKLYADLYPRLAKHLPYAPWYLTDLADIFIRLRQYEHAKRVYRGFREFFEANPPANS